MPTYHEYHEYGVIKSDSHLSMHNVYLLVRVENWFSNHRSNQLAISWNVNSLWFLSSLPDASGNSLLRQLGFGYMLSPMVAYTLRMIMQAIPARVIAASVHSLRWIELEGILWGPLALALSLWCVLAVHLRFGGHSATCNRCHQCL